MSPLRFCLLSTFYPPWNFGGDGIQVQRLARALSSRGHEVTVVCSPAVHRLLSRDRVEPAHEEPGIEVVPLRDGVLSLTGEYLTGRPLRVRRQLETILDRSYDVLHFHNPSLLGAPAALGIGQGVKLYTTHEQWLLCPSHLLLKRSGRVCRNPPCWSCEISHLRPPQLWRRTSLLERSLSHLDSLIAPSRASAELHRDLTPAVRIEVINHFAPPMGDSPREGAGRNVGGRRYFLFVGRLERIKNVAPLIEAFRGRQEDLVIAGEGAMGRSLRDAALGLSNVRFTGWLPEAELGPLYRDAIAVLIPTAGHEAFPLVTVEAMARGTPLVAHRFGALEEIVEESGAGLTYDSPEELRVALDRLGSDERLREELGRRGWEASRSRYSVDAHLSDYLSLIATLALERDDPHLAGRARDALDALATSGVSRTAAG